MCMGNRFVFVLCVQFRQGIRTKHFEHRPARFWYGVPIVPEEMVITEGVQRIKTG